MDTAVIIARSAKLAETPGGRVLASLLEGTRVAVRGGPAGWVEVEYQGMTGVIVRRSLDIQFGGPIDLSASPKKQTVPPKAQPKDIIISGSNVFGPGDIRFGSLYKLGMYNYGITSIRDFLNINPNAFPTISSSVVRVMQAVSDNEGKLEAINTYDNAFLSCSAYQWTSGTGNGQGELPYALNFLKSDALSEFQTYFQDENLDIQVRPGATTGLFMLNGQLLDTAAKKAELRKHIWAYRFWRASHDKNVQKSYIKAAISRIGRFYQVKIATLENRPLSDFLTAEASVAHLLDQHVNRPGNVPQTLVKAVKSFMAGGGVIDPARWTDKDEQQVVDLYLKERAKTTMTDSKKRAQNIEKYVISGQLSSKRNSYQG